MSELRMNELLTEPSAGGPVRCLRDLDGEALCGDGAIPVPELVDDVALVTCPECIHDAPDLARRRAKADPAPGAAPAVDAGEENPDQWAQRAAQEVATEARVVALEKDRDQWQEIASGALDDWARLRADVEAVLAKHPVARPRARDDAPGAAPVPTLIEAARHHRMSPEEQEAQRQAFARGNLAVDKAPGAAQDGGEQCGWTDGQHPPLPCPLPAGHRSPCVPGAPAPTPAAVDAVRYCSCPPHRWTGSTCPACGLGRRPALACSDCVTGTDPDCERCEGAGAVLQENQEAEQRFAAMKARAEAAEADGAGLVVDYANLQQDLIEARADVARLESERDASESSLRVSQQVLADVRDARDHARRERDAARADLAALEAAAGAYVKACDALADAKRRHATRCRASSGGWGCNLQQGHGGDCDFGPAGEARWPDVAAPLAALRALLPKEVP